MNYYNENDPRMAAWLRTLIKLGLIPRGEVDDRSILDVKPTDIRGFTQCHFFAGIGGWPYALRLAAWPEERKVWTGSCPCQPFSCAGQGKGEADERHLWPVFRELVIACRPPVIFGEQVASAAVVGHQGKRPRVSNALQKEASSKGLDSSRGGEGCEKEDGIRSVGPPSETSGENRQRFVRGHWASVQFGQWEDMGQSIYRQDRFEGGVHLQQSQNSLPCSEQCDGRLGRSEVDGNSSSNNEQAAGRLERAIRKIRESLNEELSEVWFSGISADLEAACYAVGASDISSSSVGAPNIRQRLFWVADAKRNGRWSDEPRWGSQGREANGRNSEALRMADTDAGRQSARSGTEPEGTQCEGGNGVTEQRSGVERLAESAREQFDREMRARGRRDGSTDGSSGSRLEQSASDGRQQRRAEPSQRSTGERRGKSWMGEPVQQGLEGHAGNGDDRNKPGRQRTNATGPITEAGNISGMGNAGSNELRPESPAGTGPLGGSDERSLGFWRYFQWHLCNDEPIKKWRRIPVEPEIFPLASRISGRVAMLRGIGNAINPRAAAEFIQAYLEICQSQSEGYATT